MTKTVQMQTSAGALTLELDDDKAPATVANFLAYVAAGHYNGTVFHRVIPRFMIQGGGFKPGMEQKATQAPVANESANGLQNKKYTLAMARTGDPHSATAQFFVNTADNGFLDRAQAQDGWGYAVFGRVVAGTEVIDAIERVRTGRKGGHGDVPLEDVTIESAAEAA
jgi:peptidyl-prolyl cis-trans isomerase B (cyclophilin B)